MFGYGDWFFEKLAWCWTLPVKRPKIINGEQIIQPCHYLDVARAISTAILDPVNCAGNTYEIYGNVCAKKARFMERIHEVLMCDRTGKKTYRDWNPKLLGYVFFSFLFFYFHYPCTRTKNILIDFVFYLILILMLVASGFACYHFISFDI